MKKESACATVVALVCTAAAFAVDRPVAVPWSEGPDLSRHTVPGGALGNPTSETDGISQTGLDAGAQHVIDQQCGNGGWGYPHDDCGTTYYNIAPPIAQGLLDAWSRTGTAALLDAAVDAGDYSLTSMFSNGDRSFGSHTPGFCVHLSAASGDPTYSDAAAIDFFDKLTAAAYGDPVDDPTYYPADTVAYLDRHKAGRSGYTVNLRPWDMHLMPAAAGAVGNPGQSDIFRDYSVLDGLNTLDASDAAAHPWDLLGLAGGLRGLALNGTTSFPALTAAAWPALMGVDNLCDLADFLASFQNVDGSWYYASSLGAPAMDDEDTQTTAYALLALLAAQNAGCGPYNDEIVLARAFLESMQDVDGGFFSYPGGPHYTEAEGEALTALASSAAVLNVDTGETFATIQEAHDDADTLDGHTLRMLVAEHFEGPQIVITKDLTLEGGSVDTIKATGDTTTSGDGRGWFLVDAASDLHVKDLIFDGNGFKIWQAFRQKGSGSFVNCDFHDIRYQVGGSPYAGTAMAAFGVGPVDVYGGTLDEIGRQGIFYFGSGVSGSVCTGITYTGKGAGDHLDYGIEVGAGADVVLDGNTITDCTGVASTDGSTSAGILATTYFGPGTAALVTNCDLTGNTTGLFVGFDGTDTSSVTANFNNFDNVDNGVINTSTTEIVSATDNWWGDPGGPDDPTGTIPAINGFCAPVGDIYNDNTGEDFVSDDNVEYCPWAMVALSGPPSGDLILAADDCQDDAYPGESGYQIEVTLSMMDLTTPATGFQAFIEFNDTLLTYRGDLSSYTTGPFPLHIRDTVDAEVAPGELRLDGSDDFGDPGTVADSLLATLVFTVNVECSGPSIDFDLTQPFDSELSFQGVPIPTTLTDTGAVMVDDTPPVLSGCVDITVPADANVGSGCVSAVVNFSPTATDNCGGTPSIDCDPPSGTAFPVGTTTVTCTATDDCGNESMCMFDVEVTATNAAMVSVQLVGSDGPVTRCIHFVASYCSATTDISLDFDGTGLFDGMIEIPCGPWDLLCAKDEQHTKWDTVGLTLVGTNFVADGTFFLDAGDTDNDGDVDINDVTWLLFTFGTADADGDCPWDGTRDADFDNSGFVGSLDYSLLSGNFLTLSSCPCTVGPIHGDGGNALVRTSRSTEGLEPHVAAAVDLNRDGVVDVTDVRIFEAINGLDGSLSEAMRAIDESRKTNFGR